MARNTKPRLGRGLSSLMSEPVPVVTEVKPQSSDPQPASPSNQPPQQTHQSVAADGAMVIQLELDRILPNKYQPRSPIDEADLEGLAASIRSTGLMQPIAVRASNSGGRSGGDGESGTKYELIAGERRWRAARLAGLDRIPAIVHEVDDRQSAEWAIIENVQREDLNPIDRGHAYANLAQRFGLTQAEIAERVGVDRSTVANLIRLIDLEPEIQELIVSARLSTGHGKALLSMPPGAERVKVARTAADRNQTVRALEATAASYREENKPNIVISKENEQERQVAAAIDDLATGIGEHLGTRVKIRTRDGLKGTLEIEFYDLDHFDGLMQRIGYITGS